MAKFESQNLTAGFNFNEHRLDIAISEQGASRCVRKLESIAAAFQQIDPGVAASLKGEALRLGEHLESVVKGAAVVALQTAVMASPVDTGALRAHWQVSVNRRQPSKTTTTEVDPTGISTIEEGTFKINDTERTEGQVIWISNNAPHAEACEAGWSKQAPHGMTKLAQLAAERYVTRQRIQRRGKL